MGICRAHDLDSGTQGVAHVFAAQVEAVGEAVHLERDVLLEGQLEHAVKVEGVLRATVDVAAFGVAQAAHVGVSERLLHALCHFRSRHPLASVDARLHPLEIREDVIGKIESPVGEDVALDAPQDPKWRQ
jgi:hypothetical protein